jgi:pimeloyl-ACP methyl ester carboxylesterase
MLAGALALASCGPSRGDARQLSAEQAAVEALVDAPDQYFFGDGVAIRYRVIGNGDPVLLLHGYTDRVEMWAGTADSLAKELTVIVPDLRGFGLSTKFGDAAQYGRKMVEDLVGLLDHLDVRRTHVVGYSMGAMLAAHLALDDPARVRTAAFVAGPFFEDSAVAARLFEPYAAGQERGEGLRPFFEWILPTWSDSAMDAVVPQFEVANDSASLVASLRALPSLMLDTARLVRARTPALAIVSVKDPLLEGSRFLARWWPGVRLVELPRGDHGDIFLAPELVSEFRRLVSTSRF